MKLTIQKNRLKDGERSSLYISWSRSIPHPITGAPKRKHFIDGWVYNSPKNSQEKAHNKQVMMVAEEIKAKVLVSLMRGDYSFMVPAHTGRTFESYYLDYVKQHNNENTRKTMMVTYRNIRRYDKRGIELSLVNRQWLEGLRKYLMDNLSTNSASTQFAHIRSALNAAYRDEMLERKVTDFVRPIPVIDVDRVFLTAEELAMLEKTPCRYPSMKRAVLFAAYSGPRISNISTIKRSDFEQIDGGWVLHFAQVKSSKKIVEMLPISAKAMQFIDFDMDAHDIQFPDLKKHCYAKGRGGSTELDKWAKSAGLRKHLKFHSTRHTFASLALKKTDLYTVSKLLGHANIKTTTIYAKLQMEAKRAVVDLL